MDEPLSALDEVGRREILPYLQTLAERLQIPAIYVSHSLPEVARLANRMVWLVEGQVRAVGPVAEVLGRLDFAQWRGEEAAVVADTVVLEHDEAYDLTLLQGPWGPLWVGRQEWAPGHRIRVQIRAIDVSLSLESEQATSILNHFPLRVLQIQENLPGEVLISLESRAGGGPVLLARIMRRSRDRLDLELGREVWARVKAVAVVA
jgi:molybdate transport system ATP-binding protein